MEKVGGEERLRQSKLEEDIEGERKGNEMT